MISRMGFLSLLFLREEKENIRAHTCIRVVVAARYRLSAMSGKEFETLRIPLRRMRRNFLGKLEKLNDWMYCVKYRRRARKVNRG